MSPHLSQLNIIFWGPRSEWVNTQGSIYAVAYLGFGWGGGGGSCWFGHSVHPAPFIYTAVFMYISSFVS